MLTVHGLFLPVARADEVPVGEEPEATVMNKQPVEGIEGQGIAEEEAVSPVESPALAPLQEPIPEDPPLQLPPLIIHRVTAGGAEGSNAAYDYIELFNPNPHDVFVDSWRLSVLRNARADIKQEIILKGTVRAKGYVLIAGADKTLFDAAEPDFRLSVSMIYDDGRVQLNDASGKLIDQVAWGTAVPDATAAKLSAGEALEHKYTVEGIPLLLSENAFVFISKPAARISVPRAISYQPYEEPVNRCGGLMISEIAANTDADKQFIELYNPTSLPIILDGCLLQTNRSTTKNYVLSGVLATGVFKHISISATGLTLTKTTSGTVYILSSDGREETDARTYDGLASGTSWAWFGGNDWRQTFALTPGMPNAWQEFLPCESGYERNTETGRCRKLTEEEPPVECGSGKYRNPETNRCRGIEAAAALTACKPGQYRSLETNRCRTVATASSTPAPCRPDQERNPETNRCRKKTASSIPESAFAVEEMKETGKAFIGWWALGGIGTLALGRGIWEWRSEMLAAIRKLGSFFTTK